MRMTNRYIEIASSFPDSSLSVGQIFEGAGNSESDLITEAMYVISDRRRDAGKPIEISEFISEIPELLENQAVLDAVITICIDGLLDSGYSHETATAALLKATNQAGLASHVARISHETAILESSMQTPSVLNRKLPAGFGDSKLGQQQRYELRRVIGVGAQGTVYEALDREFAEDSQPSLVAVKIAHENIQSESFQLEAARARRVRHSCIARVYDAGTTESSESFIAYELINGLPLDKWMGQSSVRISPKDACKLVCLIAQGVQAAHNSGVIHRDLKPSNILIDQNGHPYVTDFGIAYSPTQNPRISASYGTRGSLAFMSPEQYHGKRESNIPAVDTYALGGILYWLLTNRFPNGNSVSDAIKRLDLRNEGGVEREYEEEVNQRLASIVDRALAIDLQDRYCSIGAFADDLEGFLSNRAIRWLDRDALTISTLFVRRNPVVVLFNVLVMALIGVVAGVWVHGQGQAELQLAKSAAELEYQNVQSTATIEQVKLTNQITLEQDRVRQLRERNQMAKMLVNAWSQVADNRGDEIHATSNLLFLYTISVSGFLEDDPNLADKILNRRIEITEEYLAGLMPESSSAIHRAQMHEMLGVWYSQKGDLRANGHTDKAVNLVVRYAPEDTIWKSKLLNDHAKVRSGQKLIDENGD